MRFDLHRPCNECPFRKDIPAYLTPARAEEIAESLEQHSFPCHKTTLISKPDPSKVQHCAGALIFQLLRSKKEYGHEALGRSGRLAIALGILDPHKLDRTSPVFESNEDFINSQPREHHAR